MAPEGAVSDRGHRPGTTVADREEVGDASISKVDGPVPERDRDAGCRGRYGHDVCDRTLPSPYGDVGPIYGQCVGCHVHPSYVWI